MVHVQVGDKVRAKDQPSRGWQGVNGSAVGTIKTMQEDNVVVDFPTCQSWEGLVADLEHHRLPGKDDKVQVSYQLLLLFLLGGGPTTSILLSCWLVFKMLVFMPFTYKIHFHQSYSHIKANLFPQFISSHLTDPILLHSPKPRCDLLLLCPVNNLPGSGCKLLTTINMGSESPARITLFKVNIQSFQVKLGIEKPKLDWSGIAAEQVGMLEETINDHNLGKPVITNQETSLKSISCKFGRIDCVLTFFDWGRFRIFLFNIFLHFIDLIMKTVTMPVK